MYETVHVHFLIKTDLDYAQFVQTSTLTNRNDA